MIRISQLKLPVDHTEEELKKKISRELHIPEAEIAAYEIVRRSVDARKVPIKYVYQIDVKTRLEKKICKNGRHNNIMLTNERHYTFPEPGTNPLRERPIVVGSGPAGLFCAYMLASHGYRPLVLERGDEAGRRKQKVDEFWSGGRLDENSNVQFGEGGAGTFSDGKLNTLVKDPAGRNKEVLRLFVEAGAPSSILYDQKPHLGTDELIRIVQTLRDQIVRMGGEFRFRTQVTDLCVESGKLCGLELNGDEVLPVQAAVFAIGHSARDTFAMLLRRGLLMQPKSFAVGVRIEHPQAMITRSQYGADAPEVLGAASYKVTHKLENGRGIYSFCMCPGGYVVNASSEKDRLAVNGMSYHARDGRNANSALIVTVTPEDFAKFHRDGCDPVLDGIEFQRHLETLAYRTGGGKIPVQLFGDFLENRESHSLGEVVPCIKGGYNFANVREIFPKIIGDSLCEGVTAFGRKIEGFDRPDAVLSAVESRTSSPVRIVRDESLESSLKGLYPCGEGAGYAGGITSAAMDGLHVAEAICKKYMNF